MNADGHGVSAAPMLDHPADSDGADQFARAALGVGGCILDHAGQDRLRAALQNVRCGPTAIASGFPEHVGHLREIVFQLNRAGDFHAHTVSSTSMIQVPATR